VVSDADAGVLVTSWLAVSVTKDSGGDVTEAISNK
jgi:hypothetical protein